MNYSLFQHLARPLCSSACMSLVIFALGCDSKSRGPEQTPARADESQATATTPPASPGTAQPTESVAAPTAEDLQQYTTEIAGNGELHAAIKTSLGTIDCTLFPEQAPVTVANFVGLTTGKKDWVDPTSGHLRRGVPFYRGTHFHRVIPQFFIQAGDPTDTGSGGPGYTLPDEISADLTHAQPGILSMANHGRPDSSGSQWFITAGPIAHLDGRHTIFGHCEDLDVIQRIAHVPAGPDDHPHDPPEIIDIQFSRRPAR